MMSGGDDHPALTLIRDRATLEEFGEGELGDDEILDLIRDATCAPSSFNIQHWRFIAVRSPEAKARLEELAFGQRQIGMSAVTFILLGDTRGVDRLPEVMDAAVASGAIEPGKAAAWVRMASAIYSDPRLAREEAIRSTSLAAMTLLLAAEARGLGAGALIGFDAPAVCREFGVPETWIPVMLVTVGPRPEGEPKARMPRLPAESLTAFDRWTDP